MRKKLAMLVFALAALTAAATIAPTPASADACPKGSHLFTCPTYSFCCPDNAFCACLNF